jgi:hypothetical protein
MSTILIQRRRLEEVNEEVTRSPTVIAYGEGEEEEEAEPNRKCSRLIASWRRKAMMGSRRERGTLKRTPRPFIRFTVERIRTRV